MSRNWRRCARKSRSSSTNVWPASNVTTGRMPPCTSGHRAGGILDPMPDGSTAPSPAVPGVVVVWSGAAPTVQAFRIPAAGLIIGRELLEHTTDDRISRQHARVIWRDKRFVVTDLGSRNGTYAGGHAL